MFFEKVFVVCLIFLLIFFFLKILDAFFVKLKSFFEIYNPDLLLKVPENIKITINSRKIL